MWHVATLQYNSLKELIGARVAGMITEEEQLQAIADLIVSNMNLDDSVFHSPVNPLWRASRRESFQSQMHVDWR